MPGYALCLLVLDGKKKILTYLNKYEKNIQKKWKN